MVVVALIISLSFLAAVVVVVASRPHEAHAVSEAPLIRETSAEGAVGRADDLIASSLLFKVVHHSYLNYSARLGETRPSGYSNVWISQLQGATPLELAAELRAELGGRNDVPIIAGELRPGAQHCVQCADPIGNISHPDMRYDDWVLQVRVQTPDRLRVHQSLKFCSAVHAADWLEANPNSESVVELIPFSFATRAASPRAASPLTPR